MKKRFGFDEVFTEGASIARHHVKRRIIKDKLIPYCCAKCSNDGTWNGEALSLHLDHKNGVPNDNRLENLRFLCPNCHAQTDTYAGKNSTGLRTFGKPKPNFKAEKLLRDKEKWSEALIDPELRLGEYGWKTRLGKAINISPQKVTKWLMRIDSKTCGSLV